MTKAQLTLLYCRGHLYSKMTALNMICEHTHYISLYSYFDLPSGDFYHVTIMWPSHVHLYAHKLHLGPVQPLWLAEVHQLKVHLLLLVVEVCVCTGPHPIPNVVLVWECMIGREGWGQEERGGQGGEEERNGEGGEVKTPGCGSMRMHWLRPMANFVFVWGCTIKREGRGREERGGRGGRDKQHDHRHKT